MATDNLQRLREPRPGTTARRHSTPRLFAPSASISSESVEEYEVVFTEDKLGLTLRPEGVYHDDGRRSVRTVVKSAAMTSQIHEGDELRSVNGECVTDLDFSDVMCILKISARPIRLRFRPVAPRRRLSSALNMRAVMEHDAGGSRVLITSLDDMSGENLARMRSFLLPEQEPQEDDTYSHYAVQSESFGDADSTQTTEDSSVITDITETECKTARHSSRFTAFLRKPFRRVDGFERSRNDLRFLDIVPETPRVEITVDSPNKAAIRVRWRRHPQAFSYHLQYSRDWTMKVWKTWTGRSRRSGDNEHDLVTVIYGLDYAKSYVVRIRYEFDNQAHSPGEWSAPTNPLITLESARLEAYRATQQSRR